jgi:type IV pilus assembly protein PilC
VPLFTYKATNKENKVVQDTIYATDRNDAASILKSEGLNVLVIKSLDKKFSGLFESKISIPEKAAFCRFMATMMRVGMSFPEAVEIIKQESGNKKMQKILADLAHQVRKGRNVSSVLNQYQNDFDPIFLTIVKAGESAGTLDQSFDYLAKQLSASYELSQNIKNSLMYPAVVLSAMFGVGMLMVLFVLPKISDVFMKMDIELPLYTQLVFGFGSYVGSHVVQFLIVVFLLLAATVLVFVIRSTRSAIINAITKLPAARRLVNKIDVARFARTLSTLLKSGVSIMDSLDVSANSLSQKKLREQARRFSEGVSKGESLSSVLTKADHGFPLTVIQTIKAGEKTGTLDEVLLEMAEFYEKEVQHSLKRFTGLLEPILMLAIGIAVGAMVITIIAPIYSIIGGLQEVVQR